MSATLRERAEHAAKYGANLIVPAIEIKALLEERDSLSAAHEAMEAERDHERSRVERYIAAHHTISDQLVAMRAERDEALARIEKAALAADKSRIHITNISPRVPAQIPVFRPCPRCGLR